MRRHQDLSLRTAESTSLQRGVSFNEYNFHQFRIFNADETSVSCVHNNNLKVTSVKEKKHVEKLTSTEKGQNVTVFLSINAIGDFFIPPLFIFPRTKIDNDLKKDASPGSIFDGQKVIGSLKKNSSNGCKFLWKG